MGLVSAKQMMKKAFKEKWAVPHINTNNLEWSRAILESAQELNSPIIIATSEGAIRYMGGMKTVVGIVKGLIEELNITVPVALHLDHGTFEGAKKAIKEGYTSIMYDGSHEIFEKNLQNSKKIIELAKEKKQSIEVEIGTIGGEEDGMIGNGDLADLKEISKMSKLGPDMIAAGIGNFHGPYPKDWKTLSFKTLENLKKVTGRAIVLHGGSGIPKEQIEKAISMGVSKINVNTDLQQANAKAIKKFVISGKIDKDKNFDPRKLYADGFQALKEVVKYKIRQFGSENKA